MKLSNPTAWSRSPHGFLRFAEAIEIYSYCRLGVSIHSADEFTLYARLQDNEL